MTELWERLQAAFVGLSARERLLILLGGGLLVLAIVVFGIVSPVLTLASNASASVTAAEEELAVVTRLRREYDEVNGRLASVESRIAGGPSGNIFTSLEDLARRSAVKVDSMEPQPSPAGERYRETKVQVVLKGVTLAQLVNYLHHVESAEQLLSVKSLRVRTRSDKPDMLDATFTVSSFERL